MATSECPECSNFRNVDNRILPKATLSSISNLREAGLIRSERKGIQMHNTTRCAEASRGVSAICSPAILATYAGQNSRW